EDEVAAGEDVPAGPARDDRSEEARLALCQASSLHELGELVVDPVEAFIDLLLCKVAEDDRDLEPAEKEERELARHEPGADEADLLHTPRLCLGHPDPALRAALDEVERVHGRLCL